MGRLNITNRRELNSLKNKKPFELPSNIQREEKKKKKSLKEYFLQYFLGLVLPSARQHPLGSAAACRGGKPASKGLVVSSQGDIFQGLASKSNF